MSQNIPIGKTEISLAQLNDRAREVFRQIVESYLSTGDPLGAPAARNRRWPDAGAGTAFHG